MVERRGFVKHLAIPILGALMLMGLSPAVFAAEVKLSDLMQLMAQQKSGRATFVEKKFIALIDHPVESQGELAYTAPDRLEKRTFKPRQEALVLEGDQLLIEEHSGRKHQLRLNDYPEVAGFVESIRATLAGDQAALERFYRPTLTGTQERWQLTLEPSQARMKQVISRIFITGAESDVKTIRFDQTDGDHSEMTVVKRLAP